MSDWEVVQDNPQAQPTQDSQPSSIGSDWEEVQQPPNSMQPDPNESFGAALAKSPFRVGEDIYRGGMNAIKSIPGYLSSAPNEFNGLINNLATHPGHVGQQALAGLTELGQNTFNLPHDLINYATNRLNLVPQDINQQVQMARMPDREQMINETLGSPQYAGEKLLRGGVRNINNIIGLGSLANNLNPANLTVKSIAKDVVNTEKQQIATHSKIYNGIWKDADKTGFNQVPVDTNLLSNNLATIKKYTIPKQHQSLIDFINNPTLEGAQKAQSDMKRIQDIYKGKSEKQGLTTEEVKLYEAAKAAEDHIHDNMFKNINGNINQNLKNRYDKVTNSYRENVVPYKYNPFIQDYKNKKISAKKLVNHLSDDEFYINKGSAHPALIIRNHLVPTLSGIGAFSLTHYLYNQMFGYPSSEHK